MAAMTRAVHSAFFMLVSLSIYLKSCSFCFWRIRTCFSALRDLPPIKPGIEAALTEKMINPVADECQSSQREPLPVCPPWGRGGNKIAKNGSFLARNSRTPIVYPIEAINRVKRPFRSREAMPTDLWLTLADTSYSIPPQTNSPGVDAR